MIDAVDHVKEITGGRNESMELKYLERRAMLGDRQAQEECSRQGIALPCPLCGKQVRRSVSGMLFYCSECHCNTTFHSDSVSKKEALFIWNRRPAPQLRPEDERITMGKYIKTEDLLDAIYPVDPENDGSDGCTVVAVPLTLTSEEIEAMLDKIPAADVAPVIHARWIHLGGDEWACSSCGFGIHTDGSWEKPTAKHCQDCGAKMDKED